jgi:hypothetical protein
MQKSLERRARRGNLRRALLSACSIAGLVLGSASTAAAQENATAPGAAGTAPVPTPTPAPDQKIRPGEIVVLGDRAIIASLQDLPVEQTYDEDAVESYDASTVGEVLDQIRDENGDDNPAILVNGQPVTDHDDISDLPMEAISRIEALPRGAAQRVGGAAGQRAYNVVLKNNVRTATLTGSEQLATDGGWRNAKGEALLTYVKGQDRINVTMRGAQSGNLFEFERDGYVPNPEFTPYSAIGNIIPAFGNAEVDPALSALAGHPVTVVALPEGNTHPTLAQLLPGANQINPSNQGLYRTLRGSSQPVDLAVAGNKVLASWLSLSFNGRLSWTSGENFSGLPSARFLIPANNTFTPFTTPTYIALNDPTRPLRSRNKGNGQSVSTTLNATLGTWRATVLGRWDRNERDYTYQNTAPLAGGLSTVGSTTNPFDGSLATIIPVNNRASSSKNTTTQINGDADGPLFALWAGSVHGRIGLSADWVSYDANDTLGDRSFDRHEYIAKAGITVPLTSTGEGGFLPSLGDTEIAFDIGRTDLGRYGTLKQGALAFNWQVVPWLRLVASEQRDEHAASPELLAAPLVVTPNVAYFDPQTGNTADVTLLYGGAGNLQSEDLRTRILSLTASPLSKYHVQLSVDYTFNDLRDQIGALPPPSSAVVAAFPERFVRDLSGNLILVDNRSVNFARQRSEQLRFGAGFTIPLAAASSIPADKAGGTKARRIPPLNLQVNGSYRILLNNKLLIRDGLPEVDLLDGGAVGIVGGQQRHSWDLNLALTRGSTGVRMGARNRGVRYLTTGTAANPDLLTFHSITTVDVKAFVGLGQLLPHAKVLRETRLSLNIDNMLNKRQKVEDLSRGVPQAYQPVRLDPIGRTVMLEIRKVF